MRADVTRDRQGAERFLDLRQPAGTSSRRYLSNAYPLEYGSSIDRI
jgi:hypothetical protein